MFTRWADYSGGQLAIAEVDEAYAEEYIDQLKARGLVEIEPVDDGKSRKVTELRAAMRLDPVYQDAQQERLTHYARRKLLQARHSAFERDGAVVSRELSRRIERDPSARRTARHGGAR